MLSRRKLPDPIPWDEDGTYWYEEPSGSGYRIYRWDVTVSDALHRSLQEASQHHPPQCDRRFIFRDAQTLAGRYTEPIVHHIHPFLEKIMDAVPTTLARMLLEKKKKGEELTDFMFVVEQSTRRNWMHDCPLCLEEQVGVVCGCGHTEVAMFRPCGHTMCSRPCLERYVREVTGSRLPPSFCEAVDNDGKTVTFQRMGVLDITKARDFPCPLCRGNVERTIEARPYLNDRDRATQAYRKLEEDMKEVYHAMYVQ